MILEVTKFYKSRVKLVDKEFIFQSMWKFNLSLNFAFSWNLWWTRILHFMYSNKIHCEDQEVTNPHLSFKLTLKEMLRLWQNINSNSYGLTMDYQRQHENVGNEEVKWIFSTKKASSRLFLAMNFIHNAIDESVCLYFSHIFTQCKVPF